MEQIVLVHASVYNKRFITESVTMQELPKLQPSRNPSYQIDSLKKELNKKMFCKADCLVHKIESCPRIKLPNSETLNFEWRRNWNVPVELCPTTAS